MRYPCIVSFWMLEVSWFLQENLHRETEVRVCRRRAMVVLAEEFVLALEQAMYDPNVLDSNTTKVLQWLFRPALLYTPVVSVSTVDGCRKGRGA